MLVVLLKQANKKNERAIAPDFEEGSSLPLLSAARIPDTASTGGATVKRRFAFS